MQKLLEIGEEIVIVKQAVIILVIKDLNRKHGDLPYGYDHKYIYSHIGFNLKSDGYSGRNRFESIIKN